jgi:anti-anti-sigma factor
VTHELVSLELEERGELVIARVAGELDVAGAPDIGRRIEDAVTPAATGLVVDFTKLEFIDSSGIAMLFSLARQLGSRRQALKVVVPEDSPVRRVLEIVEFDRAAAVHPDLESALSE